MKTTLLLNLTLRNRKNIFTTKAAIRLMAFIFLALVPSLTKAQAGSNDPTFNANEPNYDPGFNTGSIVYASALQSDGKIITGGTFTTYNGTAANRIARLNTDGTLDLGFNTVTGANNGVNAVAIQSDGKVLIGGGFTSYNGTAINRIARLNTNGTLDLSFTVGTGVNNLVYAITLQSDGKILVGGVFTSYNGTAANHIIRLNSDGTIDATFNTGTGASSNVRAIAIQSDGKVIIGGDFTTYNVTSINRIARLNTDGSIDTGFTVGTGASNNVYSIAIQTDGKIVISGMFTTYYNATSQPYMARINTNGTKDASVYGTAGFTYTIALQSDGKIVYGGAGGVGRIATNGGSDPFFYGGSIYGSNVFSLAIQSDGKIIPGGGFTFCNGSPRNSIARLNTTGYLDKPFNRAYAVIGFPGGIGDPSVQSLALQSDGKILIGGDFLTYGDTSMNYIARANSDGSVDLAFNIGTGPTTNAVIDASVVQPDGKIIIAGNFTDYNGTVKNRIVRLNTNGTIDATFNIGTGANNNIISLALQSDGKVIIGGSFTTYNGTARARLARLTATGGLDATFIVGTGANDDVKTIAIQSDGNIIIGGKFTTYNGTASNRIARISTTGTLDATFNVGTGATGDIYSVALQSDGKVLIGGAFTKYNGTTIFRIARINTDGSLDATFIVGNGANDIVKAIAIQSDGKIIIGGWFTTYGVTARNKLARIGTTGSVDAGFVTGVLTFPTSIVAPEISCMTLQTDGKLLIGGNFNSYGGAGRHRIARVITSCLPAAPTNTTTGSLTICAGNTTTLKASGTGTLGWYTAAGGGTYLAKGTSYVTPTLTVTTTYYVQDSSSCGASGTRTAITVTVDQVPVATASPNGRCDAGTVTLGAVGNSGILNWYAVPTGGTSLGTGISFITPVISANTTYYVDLTNTCGTSARVSAIATVTTTPTIATTTPDTICGAGTATLGATSATGTLNWYQFSMAGSPLGTGTSFITPSITGTTTYYVDATYGTCTSGRIAVTATVSSIPGVPVGTPGARCDIGTVTLVASGSGVLNWYTVSTGGASVGTGSSFITPSLSTTTTYYIDATNLCGSSARVAVAATINSLPTVTLSLPTTTVCSTAPAFALTGGSPAGGIYSGTGVTGGVFDPATSNVGTFAITYAYTDGNSCSASATQNIDVSVCTGVVESAAFKTLDVFPTPTSGIMNVRLIVDGNFIIKAMNINGEVLEQKQYQQKGEFIKTFDMSTYARGIYYIQVISNERNVIKMIVLE
jgi:uncharacterized delta-60 repeat protein